MITRKKSFKVSHPPYIQQAKISALDIIINSTFSTQMIPECVTAKYVLMTN